MGKVALITGITGQDGAYLTEFLIKKGYTVHGIKRRSSMFNTDRIDHLYQDPHVENRNLILHYGDLTDSLNLTRIIGEVQQVPQRETTPFYPRSPYAVAKLYGYWITVNYREAYHMHASNGILFNHESPLRGETFVTRKVTRAVSRIVLGMQKKVYMGNLSSKRDWGHAKDYVRAMYAILQQDEPSDYVIATGITTTIRDFIRMAFEEIGVGIRFKGEGIDEVAILESIDEELFVKKVGDAYLENFKKRVGEEVVGVDPQYFRPTEVELLIGDATKARTRLGWEPEYSLAALIEDMMKNDIKLMKKESYLKEGGYKILNYFE